MKLQDFIKSEKGSWLLSSLLILALLFVAAMPARPSIQLENEENTAAENTSQQEEQVIAVSCHDNNPLPAEGNENEDSEEEEQNQAPESWQRPIAGKNGRGCGYGYDDTFGDYRYHHGLDITAEPGTPVYAAAAGTVTVCRNDDQWGGIVTVEHGGGWQSVYRCLEPRTQSGEKIQEGALLGHILEAAPKESAQEAHLHFEMYLDGEEMEPADYI